MDRRPGQSPFVDEGRHYTVDRARIYTLPDGESLRRFRDAKRGSVALVVGSVEAGFDEVYVANMGPHWADMLAAYGSEVPQLRDHDVQGLGS